LDLRERWGDRKRTDGMRIGRGVGAIGRGSVGRKNIRIVFRVVDRLVVSPFDDEAGCLEKRLLVVEGECLDTGDGGVGDGELGPLVT
jgi:hypothetical protein